MRNVYGKQIFLKFINKNSLILNHEDLSIAGFCPTGYIWYCLFFSLDIRLFCNFFLGIF